MSALLYQLTEQLLHINDSLDLVSHLQSQHILHNSEASLSIFFGMSSRDNHNHIQKIDIQITQNGVSSDFVLFFKNEIIDACAKRKSNVLLLEIDTEEMEHILIPFFEMDEIKEPYSS